MFRTRRKHFTQACRSVWAAILLVIVMVSPHPIVAKAATTRQGFLPVCPREGHLEIYPSPFYEQDRTLFLREYSPSNPQGFALWRSNDGGLSWNVMLDITNFSGLNLGPTYPVPILPDPNFQLYLAMRFGVSPGASDPMLWYSSDGGVMWEARHPCDYDCTSWLYPTNSPDVIYGIEHYDPWGHFTSGIWRTTDGARSDWTKVWDGTEAMGLSVSSNFAQDHTIFAGLRIRSPELGSAVIVSTDGGETWEGRGGDDLCSNDAAAPQLSSTFAQDHTVFVHQANSLFKSQDGGNMWQVVFPPDRPHCQLGVVAPEVKDFHLSPNYGHDQTLYMVTQDENGLYLLVSADGSATWTRQLRQSSYFELLWVLPAAAGTMPVLGRQSRDGNISVSSQPRMSRQDQEWMTFLPRVDWSGPRSVARPFTLFMRTGGDSNVSGFSYYRSDDGGVTWACMQLPPPRLSLQSPITREVK